MNDKEIVEEMWDDPYFDLEDWYIRDYREEFGLPENCELICTVCGCSSTKTFSYSKSEKKLFCDSCLIKDFYMSDVRFPIDYEIYARYGDDLNVARWLQEQIRDMRSLEDLYYIDNERVAEVGNEEGERAYKEKVKAGCCGFYDREVTHEPSGRTFKIGCNYGH